VTWAFDALGRVTTETNLLGTFAYTYDGPTARLATVTYPNGQTSTYSYLAASQERRLQTIHHHYPNAATLSKFDYTYDAAGNILTWQQQADSAAPTLWRYGYDRADQLLSASQETTGGTPTVLHEYAYGYDPAGNRLYEQIDTDVTAWTYTNLNRLQAQAGGGVLQLRGSVNEPATVTIQGVPAAVSSANQFQGGLPVQPGTNVFTVTATDGSGNVATAQYEVDVTNAPKTFTYDANGNLTSDGTRTFEWDARNELVAINTGTHRSEFTYDGERRRVRVIEKENGATQSDTKVLWCDQEICEERAADGVTIMRRAFAQGDQVASATRFFVEDHLGSVGGVTDGTSAVLARYTFDPWGRRVVAAGTDTTSDGYTGHQWQAAGGLSLALYRSYDPELGRWLSEDPAGRADGPNLSIYVRGNPVTYSDEWGLLRTVGFPADKQKEVDDAIEAIREKLKCGNCAGPDTDRLRDLVDNPGTIIKYSPNLKYCGQTGPMTVMKLNRTFSVGPKAWNCCSNTNDPKTSLASTILHELAHRGDGGEKRPRELEERCFGCKN